MKHEEQIKEDNEIVDLASFTGVTTLHHVRITHLGRDFEGSFALWYDYNLIFVTENTVFGQELSRVFDEIKNSVFDLTFAPYQGNYHLFDIKKVPNRFLTDEEKKFVKREVF